MASRFSHPIRKGKPDVFEVGCFGLLALSAAGAVAHFMALPEDWTVRQASTVVFGGLIAVALGWGLVVAIWPGPDRVIPFFERRVGGTKSFASGLAIFEVREALDARCQRVGVETISGLGLNDPERGTSIFREANRGLVVFDALLKSLRRDPLPDRENDALIADLAAIRSDLALAEAAQIKFCLFRNPGCGKIREEMHRIDPPGGGTRREPERLTLVGKFLRALHLPAFLLVCVGCMLVGGWLHGYLGIAGFFLGLSGSMTGFIMPVGWIVRLTERDLPDAP